MPFKLTKPSPVPAMTGRYTGPISTTDQLLWKWQIVRWTLRRTTKTNAIHQIHLKACQTKASLVLIASIPATKPGTRRPRYSPLIISILRVVAAQKSSAVRIPPRTQCLTRTDSLTDSCWAEETTFFLGSLGKGELLHLWDLDSGGLSPLQAS